MDSTKANFDPQDIQPPEYVPYETSYNADPDGLDITGETGRSNEYSPPPHEIRLDDADEGVEMMERSHEPLLGIRRSADTTGSDVNMADVGQSQYLEDAGAKGKVD